MKAKDIRRHYTMASRALQLCCDLNASGDHTTLPSQPGPFGFAYDCAKACLMGIHTEQEAQGIIEMAFANGEYSASDLHALGDEQIRLTSDEYSQNW